MCLKNTCLVFLSGQCRISEIHATLGNLMSVCKLLFMVSAVYNASANDEYEGETRMLAVRDLRGGQKLEIRAAVPEDAARVLVYTEQVSGESSFLTFGPGEFDMTVEQEADFFRACQRSPNRTYILGFINNELVATANVGASSRPRLRHRGEIGMSVSRAFWGLGIGAAMLDLLVEWAQENVMLTKLDLFVRTDNARGIPLYRSRGFIKEGVLRKQFYFDGNFYDLLAMGMEV